MGRIWSRFLEREDEGIDKIRFHTIIEDYETKIEQIHHHCLNQSRNLRHTISQEYVEDSYVNAIGRFITLGIAWNFGKKGAVQNNRVRNAIFHMQ